MSGLESPRELNEQELPLQSALTLHSCHLAAFAPYFVALRGSAVIIWKSLVETELVKFSKASAMAHS
eukprot:1535732-Amphidinium_carterae.3